MRRNRPVLFRGRHFEDQIIVLCVRWYLSYLLSYRDLEQMLAERDLGVDHSTITRWVLRYAPELNKRMRHELRNPKPTQARYDCRQAFLSIGALAGWPDPAAGDQRGSTSGVPSVIA